MKNPLITFFVAAYNQERFVREAVEAALAQSYSPLEVILSDDCSSDATFELMQQAAAEYRGAHKIVLNRNPVRLFLGGHLNKLVAMAEGEIIVAAAGDDISLPNRTQAICDEWERSGRRVTSIHSDYTQIDEAGKYIEKIYRRRKEPSLGEQYGLDLLSFVETLEPAIFGCTHAFSRQLFRKFGDVPYTLIHEDDVLAVRSILAGGIAYIDQPLVKYRAHTANVYGRIETRRQTLDELDREESHVRNYFCNRRTMYTVFFDDIKTAEERGFLDHEHSERCLGEVSRLVRRCSLVMDFLDSGMIGKCRKLIELREETLERTECKMLIKRMLPRPLLLRARLARSYAARLQRWSAQVREAVM